MTLGMRLASRASAAAEQAAVFWLPSAQSEAHVALLNSTSEPVDVRLSLEADAPPQTLSLLTLGLRESCAHRRRESRRRCRPTVDQLLPLDSKIIS
jgi:hypothetical protein